MSQENTNQINKTEEKTLEVHQPTQSEKFALAVERQFQANNGEIEMSTFQRKLAQNYFIAIDQAIKDSENRRKQSEPLPYAWNNLNLDAKFYFNVMAYSAIGLDPCQKNHLSIILYKNNKLGKYDVSFTIGYVGLELKAKKYGFDIPEEVITEIVYANDNFKQYKRNRENKIESYDFEVVDDFDRGQIKGGFYYLIYENPEKNRIRVFNMKDIEKRKPKYAAAEFWGGEKDKWANNQKVGKEEVEGWLDEMVLKTLKRAAYDSIPIDSAKIDENLMQVIQSERSTDIESDVAYQIESNANKQTLDFEEAKLIEEVPVEKVEVNFNNIEPVSVNQAFESSTAQAEMFPNKAPFA